ncbi:serine/threonine protein kinase [Sphingobium fluviale]|uniref:Protein kinase domain-containing protein n=1 Tax=Sphingobium fluviale TaxID=2506423 RepID=A0A4V1N3R0_9SPHN|nr:phosphotransferase [Sphingobium fluviale]RXR29536.1 hypothetical protein EQG66_06190 [Sphingobium fluviale]
MSRSPLPNGHILRPDHRAGSDAGYVIQRKLDAGGFGITYEAIRAPGDDAGGAHFWLAPYQRVAIKEFFPDEIAERRGLEVVVLDTEDDYKEIFQQSFDRFLREAERLYFLTCLRALRAALDAVPGSDAERKVQDSIRTRLDSGMDKAFLRNTGAAMRLVNQLEGNLEHIARKAIESAPLPIVHDYFLADGTAYYVMEFLDGRTLRDRLAQGRREGSRRKQMYHGVQYDLIDPPKVAQLEHFIGKSLDALEELHCGIPDQQLIHCDLKPGNIMFRSQNSDDPVLIDFGLARNTIGDRSRSMMGGTSGYAPIEIDPIAANQGGSAARASGKASAGPWTDIYSMAVILRMLCTGLDFKAMPSAYSRRMETRGGQPDPMTLLPPMPDIIPTAIARAVEQGLAIEPEDRPQSIAQWRKAFGIARTAIPTGKVAPASEIWGLGSESADTDIRDQDENQATLSVQPFRSTHNSKDDDADALDSSAYEAPGPRLRVSHNQLVTAGVGALSVLLLGFGVMQLMDGKTAAPDSATVPVSEIQNIAGSGAEIANGDLTQQPDPRVAQVQGTPVQGAPIQLPVTGLNPQMPSGPLPMPQPAPQPAVPEPPVVAAQMRRFGELGIAVRSITDRSRLSSMMMSGATPNDPVVVTQVFKNVRFNINDVYVSSCSGQSAMAELVRANAGQQACLQTDSGDGVYIN